MTKNQPKQTPFERFESFAKKIVKVPREETEKQAKKKPRPKKS